MRVTPLLVASVAGALLVVSLTLDIAFSRSLTVEVGREGTPFVEVARSDLDGGGRPQAFPVVSPIEANASDSLVLRFTYENGYPWTTGVTLAVSSEGCWRTAPTHGRVTFRAPGFGNDTRTLEVGVQELIGQSLRYAPKPVGDDTLYGSVTLCRGDSYAASFSIPIREVPR